MRAKERGIVVTVLTPTYNRADTLPKLFSSLCFQTEQKFQWVVIDDGSTDLTDNFFDALPQTTFEVLYIKKTNGGKHTALNAAHGSIKGELVIIVDSDDYLLPDAVETICKEWELYRNRDDICGFSYLKGFEDGTHLSVEAEEDFYVNDDITYRVNNPRMKGDRCEVVRTDLFEKYSFPVFEGEKFISEDMLWNTLAINYKTVYRNKLIYVCEYLEGGLSKSGRRLRLQCPNSMMTVTKTYLIKRVCLKRRIKATWLYICYAMCAKRNIGEIIYESGQTLLTATQLPFGIALYLYWSIKYLRD